MTFIHCELSNLIGWFKHDLLQIYKITYIPILFSFFVGFYDILVAK